MTKEDIGGQHIRYYLFCKRELWLNLNRIEEERNSVIVEMGTVLNNLTYKKETDKEIPIFSSKLDKVDFNKKIIYETKSSKKIDDTHVMQLKWYIYQANMISDGWVGVLRYPKIRKKFEIILTEEDKYELDRITTDILEIKKMKESPKYKKEKKCKNCSYFEYCHI
jgi:CRISPR-associated exonuclease Cas4